MPISAATLPPRSKWIGSISNPALSRAALPTMRAPCRKLSASVHGIGSRHGAMPSGPAMSHSAARFSTRRACSGSLPATSALRAPRRAAVSSTGRKSRTRVSGLRRRISTSSTRTPVSPRRAIVSRMIGRVADRLVRGLVRCGGNQSQADVRVARIACAGHHVRRRQLENGQCREREDARHSLPTQRSMMSAMPWPTPMHIVRERVAAAGALELVQRRRDEARAARAERMTERDRAAVGIDVRRVVGQGRGRASPPAPAPRTPR